MRVILSFAGLLVATSASFGQSKSHLPILPTLPMGNYQTVSNVQNVETFPQAPTPVPVNPQSGQPMPVPTTPLQTVPLQAIPQGVPVQGYPGPGYAESPVTDQLRPSDWAHRCGYKNHCWVSAELLNWWLNTGSNPLIVTTTDRIDIANNPTIPRAGAVGVPGTKVLYGPDGDDYGSSLGGRLTMGAWLTDCRSIGIEGRAFALEQSESRNQFNLGGDGRLLALAMPIFDVATGVPDALAVGRPGAFGTIDITTRSELWGAELNGVFNICRKKDWVVDLLGGFRYVSLEERLDLFTYTRTSLNVPGPAGVTFGPALFAAPGITTTTDSFLTRNQFMGGQVGARAEWNHARFLVNVSGKLAAGLTRQSRSVSGFSTLDGFNGATAQAEGGLFALPTNSGRLNENEFSLMPELEVKVGYQITQRLSAFVGYNFLYWSKVARPGDQIDTRIDRSQVPTEGDPGVGGVFGTNPQPLFPERRLADSDLFVHGFNFGIEFRW